MIDIDKILFVDFETTFDKKRKLDIKELGLRRYMMHPEVDVLLSAYALGENEIKIWDGSTDRPNYFPIICAHNVKFDGGILEWKMGECPYYYIDTASMARAVLGNRVKDVSLKTLAEYYGLPHKIEINLNGLIKATAKMIEYCKHDVWLCREIYKRLAVDFPEKLYDLIDLNVKSFLRPKLQMNKEVLQNAILDEKARRRNVIAASGVDKKILSSNKQFADYLAQKGIPIPTKISSRTGNKIPALALGDLGFRELEKSDKPLYDARVAAKSNLLETRCQSLLDIANTCGNDFAFDLLFCGAHTKRDAGASGWGGNSQNFTRDSALRECIEPKEGYNLIVGDFSQIELRILAWLSGDLRLIKMLSEGEDVYCDFASEYFGRKITRADKAERFFGKTAVLGLGYGMGAKKFQNTATIRTKREVTREEAQKAVDLYRSQYFKVPELWESAQHKLWFMSSHAAMPSIHGFLKFAEEKVILPSGLELNYPNLRQKENEFVYDGFEKGKPQKKKIYGGKLVENICQALAGEILREKELETLKCDSIFYTAAVHDELICVSDLFALDPENAVKKMQNIMESPVSWWSELRLVAEVHTGKNWKECK